jgi:hypothetical protein
MSMSRWAPLWRLCFGDSKRLRPFFVCILGSDPELNKESHVDAL